MIDEKNKKESCIELVSEGDKYSEKLSDIKTITFDIRPEDDQYRIQTTVEGEVGVDFGL